MHAQVLMIFRVYVQLMYSNFRNRMTKGISVPTTVQHFPVRYNEVIPFFMRTFVNDDSFAIIPFLQGNIT